MAQAKAKAAAEVAAALRDAAAAMADATVGARLCGTRT